jgi:lipoate-protein ligase A
MSSSESVTWYLLRMGARSAAQNMAVDEILLEEIASIGAPLLRFYSWSEPAASFGYSQRYAEVAKLTGLRPLVRRPTGGGIVPHDGDWTYSLIFPPAAEWYSLKAIQSYERVHQWVQAAFERMGVSLGLASSPKKEPQCFAGAERFDVMAGERKIAGAAQRRNQQGLLIQGSIQPPADIARSDWEEAFCAVAGSRWSVNWEKLALPAELEMAIAERAWQKFGTDHFTTGR